MSPYITISDDPLPQSVSNTNTKREASSSFAVPTAANIGKRNWLTGDTINAVFSRLASFLPNWQTVNSLMISGPATDRSTWKARFNGCEDLQLLLPVNTGNHWSLAHLDCDNLKVNLFDSRRRQQNPARPKKIIGRFIPQFLPSKYQPLRDQELWDAWTAWSMPCAQQRNDYDCGIYTIVAAFRSICDFDLERPIDAPTVRQWLKASLNKDLALKDVVDKDIAKAEAQLMRQLLPRPRSGNFSRPLQTQGPLDITIDSKTTLRKEVEWIYQQRMNVAARKSGATAPFSYGNEAGWTAEINAQKIFDGLRDIISNMVSKITTLEETNAWLEELLSRVPANQELSIQQRRKLEESLAWAKDQMEEIFRSLVLCEYIQTEYIRMLEIIQGAIAGWEEVERESTSWPLLIIDDDDDDDDDDE